MFIAPLCLWLGYRIAGVNVRKSVKCGYTKDYAGIVLYNWGIQVTVYISEKAVVFQ